MLAAPSRDWNVFKQIFADHWPAFQQAHPRYQRAYYDDLVAKMLACGHPEKMGYLDPRLYHLLWSSPREGNPAVHHTHLFAGGA